MGDIDIANDAVSADVVAKFDLPAYLLSQQAIVASHLESALEPRYPERLFESMWYSLSSDGKRLRPILCLAGCSLGGGDPELAIPTACALEMLHVASLIHDDLPAMDDDDYRRGKPANHKVFGEGIALLAGDALLAYALEFILLNTRQVPAERLLRVMHTLINRVGISGLVGGQAVDIECEGREDIDLETVEFIHTRKTGSLIDAAMVTGATLAGADDDTIARLSRYARKVGVAFQIVDDVLDVIGTRQELGKTPNKDEKSRKATYPRLFGVDGSMQRARELVDSAKKEIAPFGQPAVPLLAMAEFVCTRTS
ncbi:MULTISPECIES: polyprenyl synthetase family protein [Streptomyces]|uniref:polyprenyl synthetase family protein n=1 Tax=Streptomyces TaxID=1883 RepID=UPI0022794214|nr:farnesyl diphosphate synthase [Streptomyces noursei]